MPFCVMSQQTWFCRVSCSGVHTGNIFPPQFGFFLYGTNKFGWGTLLERRIIVGLYLSWNQFIGELVLTWVGYLVGISSFVF